MSNSMNDIQKLILAGGFLLLTGGIALLTWERFGTGYPLRFMEVERNESVIEKADRQLKEAEEYLRQNSIQGPASTRSIGSVPLSRRKSSCPEAMTVRGFSWNAQP